MSLPFWISISNAISIVSLFALQVDLLWGIYASKGTWYKSNRCHRCLCSFDQIKLGYARGVTLVADGTNDSMDLVLFQYLPQTIDIRVVNNKRWNTEDISDWLFSCEQVLQGPPVLFITFRVRITAS